VPERTAGVTERNAAVHAACALIARREHRQAPLELAPVLHALLHRLLLRLGAIQLEESRRLTHRFFLRETSRTAQAIRTDAPRRASSTRRYSTGITFTKRRLHCFQPLSTFQAWALIVRW